MNARCYVFVALALAVGAPLGWLFVRLICGAIALEEVGAELTAQGSLYLYLLCSTGAVFALFGWFAGGLADRVAQANERFARLAITDELTGLKNVRYFRERMLQEWARAERAHQPLALIMGDLDHFKRVNDSYGHAIGATSSPVKTRLVQRIRCPACAST